MFTGIVEDLGRVGGPPGGGRQLTDGGEAGRLVVHCGLAAELSVGDSVAVDGCCLTVVELGDGWWAADVVAETLARTTVGNLGPGARVNLERPVRPVDRMGGHIVQGHVDAVGEILAPAPELVVGLGRPWIRYVVEKGSVALDGVSLTVVAVGEGSFSVAVIPHTAEVTTLGHKAAGDRVNVEVDLLAKYVEALLAPGAAGDPVSVGA
ncbi:MAG: riboflavin synthase [Acidimicrobiales bacterium]